MSSYRFIWRFWLWNRDLNMSSSLCRMSQIWEDAVASGKRHRCCFMRADSASRQSWPLLCNNSIAFGPAGRIRIRRIESLCSFENFAERGSEVTIGEVNLPSPLWQEINFLLTFTLYISISIYSRLPPHWHQGDMSFLGSITVLSRFTHTDTRTDKQTELTLWSTSMYSFVRNLVQQVQEWILYSSSVIGALQLKLTRDVGVLRDVDMYFGSNIFSFV